MGNSGDREKLKKGEKGACGTLAKIRGNGWDARVLKAL
jgi:hypothetical protein